MVDRDRSPSSEPLCARPIALQLAGHGKPCDRLGPRGYNTADGHVMCLWRDAARCVGDGVYVVAVSHRVDGRLRKTHLRPECSNDQLPAAGVLHGLDDTAVLPGVDEGAVDGLLIRKDRLDLLENLAAAFRVDGGENRRDSERPRSLGESGDVVDHQRGLVAVDVCQLRWLVIDQQNGAVLRRQQRVETDLRECVHDLFPYCEVLLVAIPACSLSVRNRPVASSACADALIGPMIAGNPCGMPVHTSSRASTPAAIARSTYRRESSSSTSSSPTWTRMGGNPEKGPWRGDASGSFGSALPR